jgi:hypothetical protein
LEGFVKQPMGDLLLLLPDQILKAMTLFTLWMEKAAPFLLFVPIFNVHFRMFLIISFVLFHIGLSLTFPLALFPWSCIVFWIALLPNAFWDDWALQFSANKLVSSFLLRTEHLRSRMSSWLEIFPKNSEGFNFSKTVQQQLTSFGCWMTNALCTVAMVTILVWNIMNLNKNDNFKIPSPLYEIGHLLRVAQYWAMFAPFPYREDGWFVVESTLFNNSTWNTFHNIPVSYDKPKNLSEYNGGSMWRKYMSYFPKKKYKNYLPYFGKWLCRSWNNKHAEPERINYTELYFMEQFVPHYPSTERTVEKKLIWRHNCFANPPKT